MRYDQPPVLDAFLCTRAGPRPAPPFVPRLFEKPVRRIRLKPVGAGSFAGQLLGWVRSHVGLGLRLQRPLSIARTTGTFEDACSGIEHTNCLSAGAPSSAAHTRQPTQFTRRPPRTSVRRPRSQFGASGRVVMHECPGSGPVTVAITPGNRLKPSDPGWTVCPAAAPPVSYPADGRSRVRRNVNSELLL
jgi:hypothetical protein